MAINYEIESAGELLKVKTSGIDESKEEVMAYGFGILEAAIKNGATKVLCDERDLVYNLSLTDTYQLAKLAAQEAKQLSKIAVVCASQYLESGEFYETVAQNRGLVILLTDDMEKAKTWLEKKSWF